MILPSYNALRSSYPDGSNSDLILNQIGGQIGKLPSGTNSCVIRMSKAFNYAGTIHELPMGKEHSTMLTKHGADGKNYALRVAEFLRFLRGKYGAPSLSKRYAKAEKESIQPFLGKRGIIAWHIEGWQDATGHFTLWDGSRGLYEGHHDYFTSFPFSVEIKSGVTATVRESGVDLWEC